MIDEFLKNLKIAGGEVFEEIPKDFYITKANFAVTENGAVFISEYNEKLFLSENIAVFMPEIIVPTMHEAMKLIKSPGIFISGPSKTADIESFLVYGAHGPKRMGIILMEN